jgi:predicted DNA-binding transcriptional regulator AlpA
MINTTAKMEEEVIARISPRIQGPEDNDPQPERLFTLQQIQQAGGFSRSTLYRLRHGGGLRTITVGGVTRVRESDWQRFLERNATTEGADKI